MRTHHVLLLLWLTGCSAGPRQTSEAPARLLVVAPPPEATAPVAVTAEATAPETAARPSAAARALCTSFETCRSELPLVLEAIGLAEKQPDAALQRLRTSGLPIAYAWRGLLLQLSGRGDEAERALQAIGQDALPDASAGYHDRYLGRALHAVRELSEEAELQASLSESDAARLLPCWVMGRPGDDALVAFGVYYASTRDQIMGEQKTRCLMDALTRRDPATARSGRAAIDALLGGIFSVLPVPADGTMYLGMAVAVRNQLQDPLLIAPAAPPGDSDDRSLRDALQRAHRLVPARSAAAAAFPGIRDANLDAYARSLCAAYAEQQSPRTPAQCRAVGRALIHRALRDWVLSVEQAAR
jgi:hypothetical protein